eukprot:15334448-Ditylum_brightwellii.AAC.1
MTANKAATKIVDKYNISKLSNFNALYYAMTKPLCSALPDKNKPKSEHIDGKEATLKGKIDKVRTRVSHLVTLKWSGLMNKNGPQSQQIYWIK